MPLLSDYPGMTRALWRAARLEDYLHDLPFLSTVENIRGITVRQLTPRMCGLLLFAQSPFLYKCVMRTPVDVALFLWIVSPEYKPSQKAADTYMADLKIFPDIQPFCRGIDRYLDRAFVDQPPVSSGSSAAPIFPVAYQASIVHPLAASYGWPQEVLDAQGQPIPGLGILDKPIAQLYQFIKLIRYHNDLNGSIPSFTPYQDKVRSRIVRRWRNKAADMGIPVEELIATHKAA